MSNKQIEEFKTYLTRDGRVAYCAEKVSDEVYYFLLQEDTSVTMYYVDSGCEFKNVLAYPKLSEGEGNARDIIEIRIDDE